MIPWHSCLHHWPIVGESTYLFIIQRAWSNAELWCCLCCSPEQTIEQTIYLTVSSDAMAMAHNEAVILCSWTCMMLSFFPNTAWYSPFPLARFPDKGLFLHILLYVWYGLFVPMHWYICPLCASSRLYYLAFLWLCIEIWNGHFVSVECWLKLPFCLLAVSYDFLEAFCLRRILHLLFQIEFR